MKILLVDDNADHRELMSLALTGHDPTWRVEEVVSGEEALSRLAEGKSYDLVVLDYRLPGRDGLEVLEEIKRGVSPPPLVMITGEGDEQVAVKAMKGGAYDYVVKDEGYLQRLPVVANRAIEAHHLAAGRKRAEVALQESEERYKQLFEGIDDAVMVYSSSGRFLDCNEVTLRRLGYTLEEFHHLSSADIVQPEFHQLMGDNQKRIWAGEATVAESVHLCKDGKVIPVEVNARRIEYKGESAILAVIRDITAHKMAEEALRDSNKELLEEHNQRKLLSKRLIELLEKDRHEIAMELHDHIGQILTSLKMNLELLNDELKTTNPDLVYKTKPIEQRIVETLKEVKNVSHGLRPSILDALGLVPSLRELFNDIQRDADIKIKFFSRNIPKEFSPEKALTTYRIAQEALTNVIKHAQAKKAFVNLVKKEKVLSLSVEDDGVGFDLDKAMKVTRRRGPLGLLIMRERVVQLDGEFTIESQIGKGTHLLVEIPL